MLQMREAELRTWSLQIVRNVSYGSSVQVGSLVKANARLWSSKAIVQSLLAHHLNPERIIIPGIELTLPSHPEHSRHSPAG